MFTLSDYTPEQQAALPHEELCKLRRRAWAAHVATMMVPDALSAWAMEMERRHGPKVRVWANNLPWLIALMVVRYGEAVGDWPAAFTEKDVERASQWARGTMPNGVTLVEEE